MKRSHVFTILKLLVAVSLIAFVIHTAGWENIQAALTNIDRSGWAKGLVLVLIANCLAMLRWHVLMHSVGLNTTAGTAMRLGFIGVFFNNVVPGLTGGDLVKAIYVTRENPSQRASAVISVAVDRIIGIVALALIAAVVIPFDLELYGEAAIGIYGFLAAAGLGAVFTLSRRAKKLLKSLLGRGGGSRGKLAGVVHKFDEAVSMYRDRLGTVALALAMSFGVHLLIIFALFLFGNAIASGGLEALEAHPEQFVGGNDPAAIAVEQANLHTLADVSASAYCSIIPIIMIISAVPVAPAGWGVGEAMFAYFFEAVSVANSHALALSFTYRITVLLVSFIGGIMLVLDRKRVMEASSNPAASETSPSS